MSPSELRGAQGVRELAPAVAGKGMFDSGGKPRALHTLREILRVLVVPASRARRADRLGP
jgi:hypothetical protein